MTNEQDNDETDGLVSGTYRALADERAPEYLDERVLRMAASARRAASPRTIANWIKPAAWTATVGLSLAIVVELSEVGPVGADSETQRPAVTESVRDQFVPQGSNVIQEAEERAKLNAGPNQANFEEACDRKARESAETWSACIEELRQSKNFEDADRENAAFVLQHPDFLPFK